MVYKRYIKRGGKLHGPYYYESYRDKNGRVVSRYLKDYKDTSKVKKIFFYSFIFLFLLMFFLFVGNIRYNSSVSGKVISETDSNKINEVSYNKELITNNDLKIASSINENSIISDVNLDKEVDVEIIEPKNTKDNKNAVINFDTPDGIISLYFDLLNYSEFVERDFDNSTLNAEGFDINIEKNPEKYKWGYNVVLKDLNFMAKIDVVSNSSILIIDNSTIKIGNSYISFSDLVESEYNVSMSGPIFLNESIFLVNETLPEINQTEENITNLTETPEIPIVNEINQTETKGNESLDNQTVSNKTISNETSSNNTEITEENNITNDHETQNNEETNAITGFFIKGFSGITGFFIFNDSESNINDELNRVSVYVQRDFNDTNYNIGDLINLDPELFIFGGNATENFTVYRCGEINESGTYTMNQSITQSGNFDCITILVANVSLDCQGFNITSNNSVSGIFSNQTNTTIKNCNIDMGNSNGGYGIKLVSANNSYVINTTLNNQNTGLYLSSSDNLIMNYTSLKNNTYGLNITSSSRNNFINSSNISTNNIYDVYCDAIDSGSASQYITNTTYNTSLEQITSSSECILHRRWYDNFYVNSSNGSSVNNATVVVYDRFNLLVENTTTNSSGYTDTRNITDYINNRSVRNYYSNYTAYAYNSSYVGNVSFNVSLEQNILNKNITISSGNFSAPTYIFNLTNCTTLSEENGVYNVINNITQTSGQTCIFITAPNITLDCNSKRITSSQSITAIYSNQTNTTIKNCYVDVGILGYGIQLFNSNNSRISNNTFDDNFDSLDVYYSKNLTVENFFHGNSRNADVYINDGDYINFINATFDEGITLENNSIGNVFLNTSYSLSLESISTDSELIRKWYYMAHVTDNSSTNVPNASVLAYNNSGDLTINLTTNATGWTQMGNLTDYINNGITRTYQSSYILAASANQTLWDSHNYNATFTQNNLSDSFIVVQDLTPPALSGTSWIATSSTAVISWTTNEGSNSSVTYWASPEITVVSNKFVLSHEITITGLNIGQTYNYYHTSCDFAGNCINSSTSTFTTSSSSSTTTSGGSGGGNYCVPNVKCGVCNGGTRSCSDNNNCGGIQPYTEVCTIGGISGQSSDEGQIEYPNTLPGSGLFSQDSICNVNLECGKWSECRAVYNVENLVEGRVLLPGEQIRTCKSENQDQCPFDKIERQVCDSKVVVKIKKIERCFKNYIEIYNTDDVLISRLELVDGKYRELNVQMIFDEFGYCPYCYNGQKDFDEDEVDCVNENSGKNSCKICEEYIANYKPGFNYNIWIIILLILILLSLIIFYIILLVRKEMFFWDLNLHKERFLKKKVDFFHFRKKQKEKEIEDIVRKYSKIKDV